MERWSSLRPIRSVDGALMHITAELLPMTRCVPTNRMPLRGNLETEEVHGTAVDLMCTRVTLRLHIHMDTYLPHPRNFSEILDYYPLCTWIFMSR